MCGHRQWLTDFRTTTTFPDNHSRHKGNEHPKYSGINSLCTKGARTTRHTTVKSSGLQLPYSQDVVPCLAHSRELYGCLQDHQEQMITEVAPQTTHLALGKQQLKTNPGRLHPGPGSAGGSHRDLLSQAQFCFRDRGLVPYKRSQQHS